MASIMASGRRVSLAIPILTSIYEGLNTIAKSSRPARTSPSFPVHFVYAWLAYYFKTHYPVWQGLRGPKMTRFSGEGGAKYYDPREARKRIHKAEFVSWTCNMIVKNEAFKFVDNGNAEEFEHNYFIAIRSSYLTLRQGDKFIVEPYSPHRFGRQFGYYQDIPGTLKYDVRTASLDEGLRYWRLCVLSKSSSKAWLPCLLPNAKKFSSEAYKAWWAKVHGTFLDDNLTYLINPKSKKITLKRRERADEDKQVDGGESNPPCVHVPSIVVKCKPQAIVIEASKEKGSSHDLEDSSSSNMDRHWKRQKKDPTPLKTTKIADNVLSDSQSLADFAAQLEDEVPIIDATEELQNSQKTLMGSDLLASVDNKSKEISRPPSVKQLPPCAEVSVFQGQKYILEQQTLFVRNLWCVLKEKISKSSIDDISSMEDEVQVVLDSMKSFREIDISHIEQSLKALFEKAAAYDGARSASFEKLSKERFALQLNEAKDRLQDAQTKESKEIIQIESTKNELESIKKEIGDLKRRRKNLVASLTRQQELLQSAQADVREIEEEINALENTPPLSEEATEHLKTSAATLTIAIEELGNLDPFA